MAETVRTDVPAQRKKKESSREICGSYICLPAAENSYPPLTVLLVSACEGNIKQHLKMKKIISLGMSL